MHYYHSPSYRSDFTKRIFNTCPICAGIPFDEYTQAALPNLTLCIHHKHQQTKRKIWKWEQEDMAKLLMKESNELDKILDPAKNLKRKQKIQQIKQQLNEVA